MSLIITNCRNTQGLGSFCLLLFLIAAVFITLAIIITSLQGCTYTRNAPLFQSDIQINDSLDNNTLPVNGI